MNMHVYCSALSSVESVQLSGFLVPLLPTLKQKENFFLPNEGDCRAPAQLVKDFRELTYEGRLRAPTLTSSSKPGNKGMA